MTLPLFITIKQEFDQDKIVDVENTLQIILAKSQIAILPGARIAIAVGSRGIAHLDVIVRKTVEWVRGRGGLPFIVPAMGSHGSATAEGQKQVLAGYGITESAMGAPIYSSMEVIELPSGDVGFPVYFDRYAAEADGTIIINRIKPHTSFHGAYESGLMKMMAIGLGKEKQALAIHALGVEGLKEIMPRVARQILLEANILGGVAVVENAYDELMHIEMLQSSDIPDREPALLDLARRHMPRLPSDDIDILIVDEIGKNISGLGMDPNIIGRLKIHGQPEPERPRIKVIIVRDLSESTHGNAAGMGLADIILRQAFAKIDFKATYTNVSTTGFLERGKLPIIAEDDEEAFRIAALACGSIPVDSLRVVWIKNTLSLGEVKVSNAMLATIQ